MIKNKLANVKVHSYYRDEISNEFLSSLKLIEEQKKLYFNGTSTNLPLYFSINRNSFKRFHFTKYDI